MTRTLLLNATYEPLKVIDWRKAITLVFLDKVEALAHYDEQIASARRTLRLPAVVRLTERVPWRRPAVRFNRRGVFARDGYTCQYCGQRLPVRDLTLDHVVPRAQGGVTSWTNIVTSCSECNQFKGDRTPEEANLKLRSRPYAPYWQLNAGSEEAAQEVQRLWEPYLW